MSHKTILHFSALMHFFQDYSISPARMIPYNFQKNDALIKEFPQQFPSDSSGSPLMEYFSGIKVQDIRQGVIVKIFANIV
jgi:hypothetical protein